MSDKGMGDKDKQAASRRHFMQKLFGGAAVASVASIAAVSIGAKTAPEEEQEKNKPRKKLRPAGV